MNSLVPAHAKGAGFSRVSEFEQSVLRQWFASLGAASQGHTMADERCAAGQGLHQMERPSAFGCGRAQEPRQAGVNTSGSAARAAGRESDLSNETRERCPHPERCHFAGCQRDCHFPAPAA